MRPGSPEQILEERIARLVSELDDFCSLAKDGLIDPYAAGQILVRAQLIASFLNEMQPGKLRMVVNHG